MISKILYKKIIKAPIYIKFFLVIFYSTAVLLFFAISMLIFLIVSGLILGRKMANSETVLENHINPDGRPSAIVVSDTCGATCRCTVRIDLEADQDYINEIWRGVDKCEVEIRWLNTTNFEIVE